MVSSGVVLPVANPEKIKDLLLDASIKGATYEGTMYGYPVSTETYALYYNKALISEDELSKTWEELAKWSKEFSEKNFLEFISIENADHRFINPLLMDSAIKYILDFFKR
jgi:maltose-binding protein MalE